LLVSVSAFAQTGEDEELDSLIALYHSMSDRDTAKMGICVSIGDLHSNVDSTIMWANRLMKLATMHKNAVHQSNAWGFLEWAYNSKCDYSTSIQYCQNSIAFCEDEMIDSHKAYHYYMLGVNYSNLKNYTKGEQYLQTATDLYTANHDTTWISASLNQLYIIYTTISAFRLAEETLMRCINLDSLSHNRTGLFRDYVRMGELNFDSYVGLFCDDSISYINNAKKYLVKAQQCEVKHNNFVHMQYYYLISALYYEAVYYKYQGPKLSSTLDIMHLLCNEYQEMAEKSDLVKSIRDTPLAWCYYYILDKQYDKAINVLDSLKCSLSVRNSDLYMIYRTYYKSIGNLDSAMRYTELLARDNVESHSVADVINSTRTFDQIEFNQVLEANQKEREVELENESMSRIILWLLVGFVSVVAAFIGYHFMRRRRHISELNEKNEMLACKNGEILKQNEEILQQSQQIQIQRDDLQYKNKQITASIKYASLIQKAALPTGEYLSELFGEYFLLYRPLDIVAGDFYWASRIGDYHVLVCADCTGHGVPGAFVSMLGISLLNEAASHYNPEMKSGDILNELRYTLIKSLRQKTDSYSYQSNKDGMDLAIVMIDYKNMRLQFSGAKRPLWIWRDGDILQYKPDRVPIGVYFCDFQGYVTHEVDIREEDVLYMFSDGIPDQFGYSDDAHSDYKHFSTRSLKEILLSIGHLPMNEQKKRLENEYDSFRNGYPQIDDNILIGVRI